MLGCWNACIGYLRTYGGYLHTYGSYLAISTVRKQLAGQSCWSNDTLSSYLVLVCAVNLCINKNPHMILQPPQLLPFDASPAATCSTCAATEPLQEPLLPSPERGACCSSSYTEPEPQGARQAAAADDPGGRQVRMLLRCITLES